MKKWQFHQCVIQGWPAEFNSAQRVRGGWKPENFRQPRRARSTGRGRKNRFVRAPGSRYPNRAGTGIPRRGAIHAPHPAGLSRMRRQLDEKDLAILDALQRNGHLSHSELARMVGLAVSSVHDRVRKLVQSGIIAGWEARLSPAALGLDLLAFVYVLMDKPESSPAFLDVVSQVPEVQECHHIAGDWNFLLKIRVRNTSEFEALLTNRLKSVPGVMRTHTVISLTSHKDTAALPVRSL